MLDPVSVTALIATATTSFNAIKSAIALGKDITQTMQSVMTWADSVDTLHEKLQEDKNKEKKFTVKNGHSETAQVLDAMTIRLKTADWEKQLKHEFLYGGLRRFSDICNDGRGTTMDAYKEFLKLRRELRSKKIRERQEARAKKQKLINDVINGTLIASLIALAIAIVYTAYYVIVEYQG